MENHSEQQSDDKNQKPPLIFNVNDSQFNFVSGGAKNDFSHKIIKQSPSANRVPWWRSSVALTTIALVLLGFAGVALGLLRYDPKLPTFAGDFIPIWAPAHATSTSESQGIRNQLILPVFDFVEKAYELEGLSRDDFIDNNKGNSFLGEGDIVQSGKLEGGILWFLVQGSASDGSQQTIECHFNNSWEKTVRNILSLEKKHINFSGKIAYYIQGIIVAEDCAILGL